MIKKIIKKINYKIITGKNILMNNYYFIINYFKIKQMKEIKQNKTIIYTCITGGYDKPVIHKYFDINYEYIFFTDDKKLADRKNYGMWKIVYIADSKDMESHYLNRWYKMNPHKILKNAEYSVYIDGNIRILNKNFFLDIETKICKDILFSAPKHPFRNCLYEEAKICQKAKLDKEELIEKTINRYIEEKFPENFGLYEANILFRKHNDIKIKSFMEMWWKNINEFSRRDQLSLTYCIWKNNIKMDYLDIKPYRDNRVKVLSHGKSNKKFK